MKKRYTKKQIIEAIAYWKKQLKSMNESTYGMPIQVNFSNSKADVVVIVNLYSTSAGPKLTNNIEELLFGWKKTIEDDMAENGFNVEVVSMEGPLPSKSTDLGAWNVGFACGDASTCAEIRSFFDS